jgi:cell division protein FtsI/penicillin-binding protein 2
MAKRLQYRRVLMLVVLVLLAFAGLGYRLVDLQVLRHDELSVKAQENTQLEFPLEPRRGDILDVKGNLLATSVLVKTVCADPTTLGNRQTEVARTLAPFLQLSETEIIQKLTPRIYQNEKGEAATNKYVKLQDKVTVETWQKIQTAMTNLSFGLDEKKLSKTEKAFYHVLRHKAIFAEDGQLRAYPNQTLAAHVLGYIGTEERATNGERRIEIVGKDGIEHAFDSKLRGIRGWRVTEKDGKQHELVSRREQDVEARDGQNVVLTIDSVIQHIVETALAEAMEKHSPVSISGIVVRPRTGEILALATLPNYDPNNPGNFGPDARRNRVIADVAEPGSTFKIVVISGALNDRTVSLADNFDCEHGHFWYAGRNLHDHKSYGVLSVENIITKSSNIGAAKVGIKMGENRLYEYIRDFGFGVRTGIPLQGEVSGIFHPLKAWSKVSIAQIPMGQGIAATRLQMTMAMCAIANNGWLMRPMLVDRLEDSDHRVMAKFTPQRLRQVISESTDKLMVRALKTVVSSEGTAPLAALEHYTVAGKTGTAQKAEHGVYVPGKYFSSFIGFFPADNPELCISVTMDEPKDGHYGGDTAAPVFKQIAERAASYLNIRPEDGVQPVPETPAAAEDARVIRTAAVRSQQTP